MPKFKNNPAPAAPANSTPAPDGDIIFQHSQLTIPNMPIGTPPGIPNVSVLSKTFRRKSAPPLNLPGADLKRAVNYYADYGGCGFWRMIWPENILNGYQKAIINGLTTMVVDPRFYQGIKAVRLQRQATPSQLEFVKFLKHHSAQMGFKIIYEIDDIIFKDDIPDFNRCKVAFEDDRIVQSVLEMMQLSDEISVTCNYMKEYYKTKTGNKNITVIPNYPPRWWGDGFYNEDRIIRAYDKNKRKPRIGYCGSGTHIDVTNKTGQKDDFTHIVNHIIKTRKDYQWVMMGCFPLPLKPFIDSGEIEYADWAMIYDYPQAIHDLKLNATIAPLMDCHFNRAKSNIKLVEAAQQGIPCLCQNMCTYEDAQLKFSTGSDLIDQIDYLMKDKSRYMKIARKDRKFAEGLWLNDHMDEYMEVYFTPYGSPERKALLERNPEQGCNIS